MIKAWNLSRWIEPTKKVQHCTAAEVRVVDEVSAVIAQPHTPVTPRILYLRYTMPIPAPVHSRAILSTRAVALSNVNPERGTNARFTPPLYRTRDTDTDSLDLSALAMSSQVSFGTRKSIFGA